MAMSFKDTDVRDYIFEIDKDLHKLSEILTKEIIYNDIDLQYLSDKYTKLFQTAITVLEQFNNKINSKTICKKEQ